VSQGQEEEVFVGQCAVTCDGPGVCMHACALHAFSHRQCIYVDAYFESHSYRFDLRLMLAG
jgi:hypothetical protein